MASETLITLSVIILLLPLLSFIVLVFFGKKIGNVSSWIGTSILTIDLVLAGVVAYNKIFVYANEALIQTKFTWFTIGDRAIQVGFGVDNIAAAMLIVVTLISTLVHLFSTTYMEGDKRFTRYYSYLGLFTFSMLGIVLANNILFMYCFWELVGISSYLLIGFWYEKKSASDAGKKAFLVNRVGDLGFLMGMLILFTTYETFMFDEIFAGISSGLMPYGSGTLLTVAGIFIFCGAIGKSAQFPLHVWLPDAMEGPTPVSALIHAATMVAAGVYLVARVFPLLSADALTFIAWIGAITAFMAATIAITQTDFKKVLAYSTVSQLGYMVMSLGACAYTTGFMHLVTHAWFKAALFLASGSVIHAMHVSMHHAHNHSMDPQDINNMGGLRKTMPLTYITFLFVTLAISGVPLTSGFMSKDGILAGTLAFAQLTGGWNWLIPIAGFGAAGITAFYMFRLTIMAFHGKPKTDIAAHTKENNWHIVTPLVILAFLSMWFIYAPNPFNAGGGWFHHAMKAPVTAVPAEYQFDFMMPPDEGHEAVVHEVAHEEAETAHAIEATHEAGHVEATHEAGHAIATHAAEGHAETHAGHHYANKYEEYMHHAHMPAMIMSLVIAGLGILFAFMVYQFKLFNADNMQKQFAKLHQFSFRKWYFDEIYDATAVSGTMLLARFMSWFDLTIVDGIVNGTAYVNRAIGQFVGLFDNGVVDGFVNLVAHVTGFFGAALRKFQTGNIQTYVILVMLGLMVLVYWFV